MTSTWTGTCPWRPPRRCAGCRSGNRTSSTTTASPTTARPSSAGCWQWPVPAATDPARLTQQSGAGRDGRPRFARMLLGVGQALAGIFLEPGVQLGLGGLGTVEAGDHRNDDGADDDGQGDVG